MEKLKIKKLALVVIVIVVIFGSIPAAAAYGGKGKRKTNLRPIEEWPLPDFVPLGGLLDWDKNLLIWPFLIDPNNFDWSVTYDDRNGFILERELKDNQVKVTVTLLIKGAPFYVTIPSDGLGVPLFFGVMDFMYQLKFTINLTSYPFIEDGNIIYQPWDYYVLGMINGVVQVNPTWISVFLCGKGSGEFIGSYEGYKAGDTAKLHTVHYMTYVGENYEGHHPKYNLYGLYGLILMDMINFH